jgi:hypothetical protein
MAAKTSSLEFCSITRPNEISQLCDNSSFLIGNSFSITSLTGIKSASLTDWHCSIEKGETEVLLSEIRCPPIFKLLPRSLAMALIYVPAEQVTVISTSIASYVCRISFVINS